MQSFSQNRPRQYWGFLFGVLFFSGFFVYVWMRLDPRLIYHRFGIEGEYPVFFVDWRFIKGFFSYPGDFITLVSNLLSQGFYRSGLGALILTVIAWLTYQSTKMLFGHSSGVPSRVLGYIPAAGILLMYNRYDHVMFVCLSVLAAVWFTIIFEKIALRNSFTRSILFTIVFSALYYLTGAGSLLFAVLVIIHEALLRRSWLIGGYYILCSVGTVWFIGVYIFDMSLSVAYTHRLPVLLPVTIKWELWTRTAAQGLYVFIPLVVLLLSLRERYKTRKTAARSSKSHSLNNATEPEKGIVRAPYSLLKWAISMGIVLVLSLAGVIFSFDDAKKQRLKIDYYGQQKKWTELLEMANLMPPEAMKNIYINYNINRALYYSDRMTEEMFSYPQSLIGLLMVHSKEITNNNVYLKRMQLFLELGSINIAERLCYEMLEVTGDYPYIIEQLAVINLVKGQTETARVYLNALSKDLIYGENARKMLRELEKDPELNNNEYIQHLRSIALTEDRTELGFESEHFFNTLLERNRHNRMSFEYMMAFFLLTRQVDKIATNIGRLDDLGYTRLPRYYEEALIIHMGPEGRNVDIPAHWHPCAEAFERAKRFDKVYTQYEHNPKKAMEVLAEEFGESYYYYYMFQVSGVKK